MYMNNTTDSLCCTAEANTTLQTNYAPIKINLIFFFKKEKETRGQTAEARKTTILQPVEQKPHSQKDRQDEKAESYIPDEGTR